MNLFELPVQVRWSDLDPNFHLRHSVYYDWGAVCRVEWLTKIGLTLRQMQELKIGPILFREECVFRKEVKMDDRPTINLSLTKGRKDFSRFTICHEIKKKPGIVSAILTVDIAWIDTVARKLTKLPPEYVELLSQTPLAENFVWEP